MIVINIYLLVLANVQTLCCSDSPSPLQAQVISATYSGKDVKVCSNSCRERTLSYLIPAVKTVHDNNTSYLPVDVHSSHPSMLILAPSRHCCVQLEELTKLLIAGTVLPSYKHLCDIMII